MDKTQIVNTLKDLIINNSNLEAASDEVVAFNNIISVKDNADSVVIQFGDCKAVLNVKIISD